jgi:tetratricopeptide (TPR) repeat protein
VTIEKLEAALAHHKGGRYGAAAALYRAVLAVVPEHPVANHNLGVLAMQTGRLQAAVSLLEKARAAQPRDPRYWSSLARCRYLRGEWEQATALLEKAGSLGLDDPGFSQIRSAMAGKEAAPGGHKIFCVGRNKTGTTSLEAALRSLGFRMGLQARGEMLKRDWARRDFSRIVGLCRTADAFQDVPFSQDYTFQALDPHFPGSKFILTVRDSPEQWYESLVRYHTKIVNKGRVPTADDLKEFSYRYQGYLWESAQLIYGVDEKTLYDREIYISHYLNHNRRVVEYFRDRPDDLLVLNVAEGSAMEKLYAFLGIEYRGQQMPHLNKSG